MSKKLNADSIVNELRGGSAFFPSRSAEPSTAQPAQAATPSDVTLPARQQLTPTPDKPTIDESFVATNEQTVKRTFQRRKIRHTFDIYHDQLLSLRETALQREIVFGERVLLGDLVQEALDLFITKERNKE